MFLQRFREQLKEYFTFTRKERNGILVLFLLLMVLQSAIIYTHYLEPPVKDDYNRFREEIIAFEQRFAREDAIDTAGNRHPANVTVAGYFIFDPNKSDSTELQKLGLSPATVQSIVRYRNKGGRFRIKEDLKKIYTLSGEDYRRLEPYIKIDPPPVFHFDKPDKKLPDEPLLIELNAAAKEDLMKLPMVGEKRADQIIKFRQRLGGFYSKEQLREVYSINDSIYNLIESKIYTDASLVRTIDINAIQSDTVYHPYMKKQLLRLIISYRDQHGSYHSLDDLSKFPLMTDSVFLKLKPYLVVSTSGE